MNDLNQHPSDIAKAAVAYLSKLEGSSKTKRTAEDALFFFIESLKSEPEYYVELPDGSYGLKRNWNQTHSGSIGNYLDWFLPRKVMMGDDAMGRIPGALRKFIEWSFQESYIDQKQFDDLMDALPKGKTNDVKRLRELESMLFKLHTPDPGAWQRIDKDRVQPLMKMRQPEQVEEGYMEFVRADGLSGFFRVGRKKLGPVLLTPAIIAKFKPGDVANLTVGKYADVWHVLETGNVYPPGVIG